MENKIIFLMLASMMSARAADAVEFKSLLIAEKVLDLKIRAFTGSPAVREYAKKQRDVRTRKDLIAQSVDAQRADTIIRELKKVFKEESLTSNIKKNRPYFYWIFEGQCSAQNVEAFWKEIEALPDSSLHEDTIYSSNSRIGDSASRPLILQYFKDIKSLHDYYVKK